MKTQEKAAEETCYKCNGDGGEQLEDGWMPCFRCSTTGKLPLGTKDSMCDQCDGSGDVMEIHPEDSSQVWSKCEFCTGGTKLPPAQAPKKMACGHYSHEDGGPADYPAKCRR